MIIQKAGVFKFFRYLGIFCAITMGFFSIVATSEDDVKDALNLTFDKDYDLSTGAVAVDKNDEISMAEEFVKCTDVLSVNGLLMSLPEYEDIEEVDIDKINVTGDKLRVRYKEAWTDPDLQDLSCKVGFAEISEPMDPGERDKYEVETDWIDIVVPVGVDYTDWIDITVTPEVLAAVNYFLTYLDATFEVCVECNVDLNVVDDFGVTVDVQIPITIEGSL